MQTEEKLREAAGLALDHLIDAFKGEGVVKPDLLKLASVTVGQWQKHLGSKAHKDALQFMINRTLAQDRKELQKMIAGTMPDYNPNKKLKN